MGTCTSAPLVSTARQPRPSGRGFGMTASSTGVADYAAVLDAALRKDGVSELPYHIGNNAWHREIYARALSRPGVVVLHDAVLHHFFLGTLSREQYIEEFVYNYGEWSRGLAEDLWANRARSAADPRYFDYPMLKRLVSVSRAVVVHNPAAERLVRRHNPEARVIEIPHFFSPPPHLDPVPDPIDVLRFRQSLGLHPRTLLVGVFGHLRETKRIPTLLRAMERLWRDGADAWLLVQGSFASSDLERAVAPLLKHPRILRAGFLEPEEFWKWAAAVDVCVNLRFPSAGETSGIAIALMGIGKTVAFSAGEEIARIPDNACLRVDRGPAEADTLADYLRWLTADRQAVLEIGRRAAETIRAEHDLEKAVERYSRVLREGIK
jgi:glycosyltransferase involved in cell wall biosynthesis